MNVRTVYHMADCTTALFMSIKLRNMRRTAFYFLCKHCAMDTALPKMEKSFLLPLAWGRGGENILAILPRTEKEKRTK